MTINLRLSPKREQVISWGVASQPSLPVTPSAARRERCLQDAEPRLARTGCRAALQSLPSPPSPEPRSLWQKCWLGPGVRRKGDQGYLQQQ